MYDENQSTQPTQFDHQNSNQQSYQAPQEFQTQPQRVVTPQEMKEDYINGWLYVLASIIPLFGLIYYFVIKDEKPRCAKTILQIFIVEICVCAISAIISIIIPLLALVATGAGFAGMIS